MGAKVEINAALLSFTPPNSHIIPAASLQVAPHILIHWRPDDSQYKAFLSRKAPVGATVEPPSTRHQALAGAKVDTSLSCLHCDTLNTAV